MNRLRSLVFVAVIFTQALSPLAGETNSRVAVFFSPKGGCTEAVVEELGKAREIVLVQAYSFTSAPIAKALVEAHQRGVRVEVLLDKSRKGNLKGLNDC
jgi:phosphatidylserine/phosphatidylglycerophosphate/cardiolipin synthase-like enzyme